LEDATDNLAVLSLQGFRAREAMERTAGMGLEGQAPLEHVLLDRGGVKWCIVHRDRTGLDGYDLWLPPEDAATVWQRWISRDGIRAAGHRALDWLRTEAGIPWFGVDVDERRLPMEVGLESALSITKGCYRGQEIIARITYRAHLGRKLAAVALESSDPPVSGADVRSGGVSIGEVTSAAFSPRLGNALALVILKSEFTHPGTPVEVALGETYRPARVTEVPLHGR
jgi:folate-binding protein YgfZ